MTARVSLAVLLWAIPALARAGDQPPRTPPERHWAFVPPARPAPPPVAGAAWCRNPIDRFILARLEQEGTSPTPEADRATLLRRLTFDLTGLPPTPEEIDAFLNDDAPDAYEKVVERLLHSPAHGERWARHWLDVARYADSEGYESDHPRPYAWRYRDYVVGAFNRDKPYDRFLTEQIAGDELLPYSDENLIATGFLAAARLSSNEEDKPLQVNDVLVDIVNATGSAVLGLTLQCAQCHDHKFDPITQRDYYRFQGFFVKGMPNNLTLRDPEGWKAYEAAKPPEYDPARKLRDLLFEQGRRRRVEETREKLSPAHLRALEVPAERRTPEEERLAREADLAFQFTPGQIEAGIPEKDRKLYGELKKKLAEIEKNLPDPPQTFGFYSPATSPTNVRVLPMAGFYPPPYEPEKLARARAYLLKGGDVHRRGEALDAGWPAVFGTTDDGRAAAGRRLALAEWLTRPGHPLTARVWVNRIWQWHFGRGLVATPNDFGTTGAPPSHPELLDWLATELIRGGWSTRHIHRLIVTSATYRQSSRPVSRGSEGDAEKRDALFARWKPRRLEAEALRDAMLAACGELDRRTGGPPDADEKTSRRRMLYLLQRRQQPAMARQLFDAPTAAAESCPARVTSTTPLAALFLLNNPVALRCA
ncbi:MAG TPA: DUF1549 and DUF1553 domain-containing protein, partial [Gemmataceae bacterium]